MFSLELLSQLNDLAIDLDKFYGLLFEFVEKCKCFFLSETGIDGLDGLVVIHPDGSVLTL